VVLNQTLLPHWQTNSNATGRDAGISTRLWDQDLWLFGDTFNSSGAFIASSTAGWSKALEYPWEIYEETDPYGNPLQLYPFTETEIEFNEKHFNHPAPCCLNQTGCTSKPYCNCPASPDPMILCIQRYAIWPGRVFPLNETHAIGLYSELYTGWAPFDFRSLGTGVAYFTKDSTVATRLFNSDKTPLYVFSAQEPPIGGSAVYESPFIYFYLPVNSSFCVPQIIVTRVEPRDMAERKNYQFYVQEDTWSQDISAAKSIGLFDIGSVMYSDYFNAYLSFSLGLCSGGKGTFRTALSPLGPWSDGVTVDILGADKNSYAGELHRELENGSSLVISYLRQNYTIWFDGEIQLLNITFK
jgi:hypothetical protein